MHQLKDEVKTKQHQLSLHSEDVEGQIEQLKSDYFDLLNEQASIRNERKLLEEQQRQAAMQLERLTQNNQKHIEERVSVKERKKQKLSSNFQHWKKTFWLKSNALEKQNKSLSK
ncbi:hypothetical protein BsIDN1_29080 [Bacillus safensis]|uniref:Uncharacterized protein n=1 Tax=Bacillus safensis TaxID=561879 RepID=A0A5S9M6S7_BACIA|nr:hypothetical protein BsIDN1_29080 [Bacillus safensis]